MALFVIGPALVGWSGHAPGEFYGCCVAVFGILESIVSMYRILLELRGVG